MARVSFSINDMQPMNITASSLKLRANAPEGRKAIPYQVMKHLIATFGDIMGRLNPPGHLRFAQAMNRKLLSHCAFIVAVLALFAASPAMSSA